MIISELFKEHSLFACLGGLILLQSAVECHGTVCLTVRQFIPLLSTTAADSYTEQESAWWEEILISGAAETGFFLCAFIPHQAESLG